MKRKTACIIQCFLAFFIFVTSKRSAVHWNIKFQQGQKLRLRKVRHSTNPHHTCYEITCEGEDCVEQTEIPDPTILLGEKGVIRLSGENAAIHLTGTRSNSTQETAQVNGDAMVQVCYPAVVVTGLPKCGTSAMYKLLSKFPGAVLMNVKENCPFSLQHLSLWTYFKSLPRMTSISQHSLIIDGCIMVSDNMKLRELLHDPTTFYLVMIRDYTDMLWSAYNFWCKQEYDGNCEHDTHWTDASVHIRTPELFHSLVQADRDRKPSLVHPFQYDMVRPCLNASRYYTEFVSWHLHSHGLQNHTMIIASEELEAFPMRVAHRVAGAMAYDISGLHFSDLGNLHVNMQDNKGANSSESEESANTHKNHKHLSGRYNISHYLPVLPETRVVLDQCWRADCLALAKIPPYYRYSACYPQHGTHTGPGKGFLRTDRLLVPV